MAYVAGTKNLILVDKDIRKVLRPDGKIAIGAMTDDGFMQLNAAVSMGSYPEKDWIVKRLVDGAVYLVEEK